MELASANQVQLGVGSVSPESQGWQWGARDREKMGQVLLIKMGVLRFCQCLLLKKHTPSFLLSHWAMPETLSLATALLIRFLFFPSLPSSLLFFFSSLHSFVEYPLHDVLCRH